MPSTEVYATAADIRARIDLTSIADDTILLAYATAVSRLIDGFMGRPQTGFVALAVAAARVFAGTGERYLFINENIEITAVKLKDALTDATFDKTLAANEFQTFRGSYANPNFNDLPYSAIMLTANATVASFLSGNAINHFDNFTVRDTSSKRPALPTVEITAKWGYALAVPEVIKEATVMQSVRIYKRLQGSMADALLSSDLGQARFISKLDKDVQVLLEFSGIKKPKFAGR